MDFDEGSDWRVVKETCLVDAPEKAAEGRPSMAASHAAPLEISE